MKTLPTSAGRYRRARAGAPSPRSVQPLPVACPIFIAYADVTAARHALGRLEFLFSTREKNVRLLPMLWRFDQLDAPSWREMALRDAAGARAVVLALSERTALSAAAENWLTSLAARQRGATLTVLTFLGDEAWTISLQQKAAASAPCAAAASLRPEVHSGLISLPPKSLAAVAA